MKYGMSDLISRQQAIEALHNEIVRRRISEDTNDDGTLDEFDTEAILSRLPSEESEWIKPTGMMPPEYFGRYKCAKCNGWAMNDWKRHKTILTKFCPHCGRPMKNGVNE